MMEATSTTTVAAARKAIDELRKQGAPAEPTGRVNRAAWANILGPAFETDNSASLRDGMGRRAEEQRSAQTIATAARIARERAEFEAQFLPRPQTPEEQARAAEQAAYFRRWRHALGMQVNGTPQGLPEVPDNAA